MLQQVKKHLWSEDESCSCQSHASSPCLSLLDSTPMTALPGYVRSGELFFGGGGEIYERSRVIPFVRPAQVMTYRRAHIYLVDPSPLSFDDGSLLILQPPPSPKHRKLNQRKCQICKSFNFALFQNSISRILSPEYSIFKALSPKCRFLLAPETNERGRRRTPPILLRPTAVSEIPRRFDRMLNLEK